MTENEKIKQLQTNYDNHVEYANKIIDERLQTIARQKEEIADLQQELTRWKLSHAEVTRLLADSNNNIHFFRNQSAVSALCNVILLLKGEEPRATPPQGEY